jgi:exodeoxyribonuclease-3
VRLVSWNCCERFETNLRHLQGLEFDVAVVTEASRALPDPALTDRELSMVARPAVEAPGSRKCIAVLAQAPWRVESYPGIDQPWLLAARVSGPEPFVVLAFWALGPEWTGLSYTAQAERVIREVLATIDEPVVLAGDFNAPIQKSAQHHQRNVDQLAARGLVSAFQAARPGCGPLDEPTYYHQRKREQPFHIDHVFVPSGWTPALTVQVGTYDEWVATRRSDHVPVIVDAELPAPTLRT